MKMFRNYENRIIMMAQRVEHFGYDHPRMGWICSKIEDFLLRFA